MREYFKTKKEARAYRYNTWAGNPKGNAYIESDCAYPVWSGGRGLMQHQCSNKNGHGPDGLYCHIHVHSIPTTETKTWYQVNYSYEIEPVEITKATKQFVWLSGSKISRTGQFYRYFESFDSASKWVIERNEIAIAARLAEIERARDIISKTKQLSLTSPAAP